MAEAEGPKHLYILRLEGNIDAFLGRPADGQFVLKAGFSKSPDSRRDTFNKFLPKCAFRWAIQNSTHEEGLRPYPTSTHAKAGENAMHVHLAEHGESLGGEFFLASGPTVEKAWAEAKASAESIVR